MSYDIKLQNKCDHRINWEQSSLGDDSVSISLSHPVSSVSSLSLRINGVIINPTAYSVVTTRQALSLNVISSIKMKSKVKDWQPLIEVSYVTSADNCPKCLALKTVDDLSYTSAGDITTAKKEYLLLQCVEKIIVTKINSNQFHDWYGTGLQNLIGTKVINISLVKTKIVEQVSAAIEKLRNLQKQLISSGRTVDPGELFGQLLKIDVQQAEDPTIILVTVVFTSQSNQTLEFSQLIDLSTTRERLAFA